MGDVVPIQTPDASLPQNLEAEQGLLSAILINNEAYHRVSDFLKAEHFADPFHARIFDASASLIISGRIANPVTIKNTLDSEGARYVVQLAAANMLLSNAADYGRTIYDCYLRRGLIKVCDEAVNQAKIFDFARDASAITEQLEGQLFVLTNQPANGGPQRLATGLAGAIAHAERAYKAGGRIIGVTTGFPDLDRKLGGLIAPDLIVLAGRPSMGKTNLAVNIAVNAAKSGAGAVGIFSLEMGQDQIAQNILARLSRISADRQRRGDIDGSDISILIDAAREADQFPVWIDDTPSLGVAQIRSRARRLARKEKLCLIVIDHLQLMRQGSKQENRRLEIGEITSGLKAVGKELGVPVLLLSQLSRAVESRDDKRPLMSDLRESGDIEQDADAILFVYRAEYYLAREQPRRKFGETQEAFGAREADWQSQLGTVANKAEIIVAKQRMGTIGIVNLRFDPMRSMFDSVAYGAY